MIKKKTTYTEYAVLESFHGTGLQKSAKSLLLSEIYVIDIYMYVYNLQDPSQDNSQMMSVKVYVLFFVFFFRFFYGIFQM